MPTVEHLHGIPLLHRILKPGTRKYIDKGELYGLSPEIKTLLATVFDLDYMMAAQFEDGAATNALALMSEQSTLRSRSFMVDNGQIKLDLIIVCPDHLRETYESSLVYWATEGNGAVEYHGLNHLGTGQPFEFEHLNEDLIGWLDLTHNVAFFLNTPEGKSAALQITQI